MNEYKKEEIRNIHYNNKNEIQFEYGGQVHHYRMENLKEVFINCWNLQQENKILKENAENNDKAVDKVNWENILLKKENKQLKDNWNKLKKYIKTEIPEDVFIDTEWFVSILDKMQELEGSNE